uniref:Uncharacterized protein n=1 Tax=Rhizobium phage IG49 TaxID=3129228 RepID=A0AAU8HYL1_9CAUD
MYGLFNINLFWRTEMNSYVIDIDTYGDFKRFWSNVFSAGKPASVSYTTGSGKTSVIIGKTHLEYDPTYSELVMSDKETFSATVHMNSFGYEAQLHMDRLIKSISETPEEFFVDFLNHWNL